MEVELTKGMQHNLSVTELHSPRFNLKSNLTTAEQPFSIGMHTHSCHVFLLCMVRLGGFTCPGSSMEGFMGGKCDVTEFCHCFKDET